MTQRYLIISTMKNEGAFILEWIAYHRVIGFSDFLIYTNDCDDPTVEILIRLEELGLVKHEANQVLKRGPHKSALKAAKEHALTAAADWILISDIDEFLVVKVGDGSVQALVNQVPTDTEIIPVTWRLFSHNNQSDFVDGLVIEQFTDAERPLENQGFPDRFTKALLRNQHKIKRFGLHGPKDETDMIWRQPDGRLLGEGDNLTRPATQFAYDVAQVNHYAVGAVDSFLVKRDRGRANHWRDTLGIEYWQKHCRGGEADTSILAHSQKVKNELARLFEDAALKSLHDAAVAWRKNRISALKKDPAFALLRSGILELSKAGDHLRPFGSQPYKLAQPALPVGSQQEETLERMATLCSEIRALAKTLSPHTEAELALEHLDSMEKGLFGKALAS